MMRDDDTACLTHDSPAIELLVRARPRDIGGFSVRRSIPTMKRRLVGPFIFFDHMGPAEFAPGDGLDVRPHPHIALATVTYLFEGEIFHRDSLGSAQAIRPGDVNWMVAGRGIAHSERTAPGLRQTGQRLHGIQAWVALPKDVEESEPAFFHHAAVDLPRTTREKAELRIIAGAAYGLRSPVKVASPTFYVDATMPRGAVLTIPPEYAERAFYVASGTLGCEGDSFGEGDFVILAKGSEVTIGASEDSRVMLLGGERLEGERHIYWNFVSSSKERIERAKADWKEGRFPKVAGDEVEFIPLPEERS